MTSIEIRGLSVTLDPARTRDVYDAIAVASPHICSCAHCANFRALGSRAFPEDVLAFFAAAGIDAALPAETFHYQETVPGMHLYGGEYCFFGDAELTDASGLNASGRFDMAFTEASPLAQAEFQGVGVICMTFIAALPWVIADAP